MLAAHRLQPRRGKIDLLRRPEADLKAELQHVEAAPAARSAPKGVLGKSEERDRIKGSAGERGGQGEHRGNARSFRRAHAENVEGREKIPCRQDLDGREEGVSGGGRQGRRGRGREAGDQRELREDDWSKNVEDVAGPRAFPVRIVPCASAEPDLLARQQLRCPRSLLKAPSARSAARGGAWALVGGLRRAPATSSLLALHAAPHDLATYDFHPSALLHLGIVLSWDSLSLHGAASFSNFGPWAGAAGPAAACAARPLALLAFHLAGQESLSGGQGGQALTSGVFSFWAGAGLGSRAALKLSGCLTLLGGAPALAASYFHLHLCSLGAGRGGPAAALGILGLSSLAAAGARPQRALPAPAPADLISGGSLSAAPAPVAAHHISAGARCAWAAWPARARAAHAAAGPAAALAVRLALAGGAALWHAAALLPFPPFAGLLADCVSAWALFAHHTCAGLALLLGSASHAAIGAAAARALRAQRPGRGPAGRGPRERAQRDSFHGHLGWVSALLGCHSPGLYAHGDSVLALGRRFDSFSEDAIQARPLLALAGAALAGPALLLGADRFVCMAPGARSTADFEVAHVHSFGAHVLVLILCKGPLLSGGSRLVASKGELGFRFPCDGPGRGGSCQVSSWDHVYLALFWLYNLLSALLFGAFWKLQGSLLRVAPGYGLHSGYVQGWLRDFLWAQASQAIQGYGGARGAYSLLFLLSHLAWALSLMFLFSGRGYWQELIEALLWAHLKLALVPSLQPRALSITQGRAVGVAHFMLGGAGASWSFFFSRLLGL